MVLPIIATDFGYSAWLIMITRKGFLHITVTNWSNSYQSNVIRNCNRMLFICLAANCFLDLHCSGELHNISALTDAGTLGCSGGAPQSLKTSLLFGSVLDF